ANPAHNAVITSPALQRIVPLAAVDRIIPRAAVNPVIATAAVEDIVVDCAGDGVVAACADHLLEQAEQCDIEVVAGIRNAIRALGNLLLRAEVEINRNREAEQAEVEC